MFDDTLQRCVILGRYIAESGATVRDAASRFGISKSTVHKDVTERLKYTDRNLWLSVSSVLAINKAERHLRGGEATKQRYLEMRQESI